MAISQGRRISIILDPGVDEALRRISVFQKRPVATLVRELLESAEPALIATADALDLVKKSPERAVKNMIEHFDHSLAEAQQEVFPLRRKPGRKPKG